MEQISVRFLHLLTVWTCQRKQPSTPAPPKDLHPASPTAAMLRDRTAQGSGLPSIKAAGVVDSLSSDRTAVKKREAQRWIGQLDESVS